MDLPWRNLPGAELVEQGLSDLQAGRESEESLLVSMAAPRLLALGVSVPARSGPGSTQPPGHRLYELLSEHERGGAYSRYNALVRRLASYCGSAEGEHAPTG